MPDIFTKSKRSAVMAAIRSQGNKGTELRLLRIFRAHGVTGWRRGRSLALNPRGVRFKVQGVGSKIQSLSARSTGRVKPDFVFRAARMAVFVDGCFWHGCPKHATWPKTRAAFWRAKILRNRERDRQVDRRLRQLGWRVVRVWEHSLRRCDEAKLVRRLHRSVGV
ncbi:MAG: very short patch repair endonuclease [Opitutae bacterium]|nr:very short patch repair endonuclease [Opitutae bacterium]